MPVDSRLDFRLLPVINRLRNSAGKQEVVCLRYQQLGQMYNNALQAHLKLI